MSSNNNLLQKVIESCPTVIQYQENMPLTVFLEITNACNLRCRIGNEWFCYYYANKYPVNNLSDEQWLQRIQEIKEENPSLYLCTWIGGEPLLRENLIRMSIDRGDFAYNLVATNGTIKLPSWDDVFFIVGINGLREQHDAVRGQGTYDIIRKNIEKNRNVILHPVVNAKNHHEIEEFVSEWNGKVFGINFGMYVPPWNVSDSFEMPNAIRDSMVERLLKLKERYGDFILHSKREIELMGSKEMKKCNFRNCFFWTKSYLTYDSMGRVKSPCPLQGDCNKCNGSGQGHAIYREKDANSIMTYQRMQMRIIKEVLS